MENQMEKVPELGLNSGLRALSLPEPSTQPLHHTATTPMLLYPSTHTHMYTQILMLYVSVIEKVLCVYVCTCMCVFVFRNFLETT